LLPTLTPESAASLEARHRRRLRSVLSAAVKRPDAPEADCRVAIAILQCIAAIGDLDSYAVVEAIARRRNLRLRQPAVTAQAQECLKALELTREQARSGGALLRASTAPAAHSEALLRSTELPVDTLPAELLRPEEVEAAPMEAPFVLSLTQETDKEDEQVVIGHAQ
jgi:hypothetical protein